MKKEWAFIYYNPHYLHQEWANQVCDKSYPFLPKLLFLKLRHKSALLHQPLSTLQALTIPQNNILTEGFISALPVILKKIVNKKVFIVVINSDTFFYNYELESRQKQAVFDWYLRHIDAMITTSHWLKDKSSKYFSGPIQVAYPYVDYEKFSKVKPNFKSNDWCAIGNASDYRGSDILAQAFLNSKLKGKLYIVGREQVSYPIFKISKRIIITGRTSTPQHYLEKCGYYINLSRHDSFGINILEAMAAGIPPLVSESCGASEVVKTIDPRLVVSLQQHTIIERMHWLAKNPALRKKWSSKCKQIAKTFTKQRSMQEFRQAFNIITHQ